MKQLIRFALCSTAAGLILGCGGTAGSSSGVSNSSLVIPNQVSIVTAN
jgi:hypothetical protein